MAKCIKNKPEECNKFKDLILAGNAYSQTLLENLRLIGPETQEDILESNKTGELWVKGPGPFKKSPTEIESVIIKHPGVLEVAVTGIPDDECGDLVVACVVPQHNTTVTAQEIKGLFKESLADVKQLQGCVIFIKQLLLTSTSKVNRALLKKMSIPHGQANESDWLRNYKTQILKMMKYHKHASDAVFWYLNELGSRVVANTGIPSDRHHIGKLVLQSLKDAPDFIMQIDGGTGETDTFQSALTRSVTCANAFRNIGLKADDVIILMASNYNDLSLSAYAALYIGIIVAGVDMTLGIKELGDTLTTISPKVIFCENEKAGDVAKALCNIKLDARIITLNKGGKYESFSKFIRKYGNNSPAEEFKAIDLDPEKSSCWLLATSGTTGAPKYATLTHTNIIMGFPYLWMMCSTFPTPVESTLITSPVQWLSAIFMLVLSPILRFTRIQSSLPITREHTYFLINKYKPSFAIFSPPMATSLIKPEECVKCDFSCFKVLLLGGSAVSEILLENMKKIATKTELYVAYGFSEIGGFAFNFVSPAPRSLGRPLAYLHHRLIDPDTQADILEPNKTGELWVKGPVTFKGYYNNAKATAGTFMEDGWIKSGDLLFRDENWNFFFVDRLKMLLKYRNHQISPTEVESVIMLHPGVLDVAVTGIPDDECGDLAVACVVPQHNNTVTAQEIKDLVKESLADTKQLRGGVIFMKQLPLTSTSKVNRAMLKKIVGDMKKE